MINPFQQKCQKKLKELPKDACCNALINLSDHTNGCPWSIQDAQSHFCFWVWLARYGDQPQPDSEIKRLLELNVNSIDTIIKACLQKLNHNDCRLLQSILQEIAECNHELVTLTGQVDDGEVHEDERTRTKRSKKSKKHHGIIAGQLLHHTGKRTNLFGLSKRANQLIKHWNDGDGKPMLISRSVDDEDAEANN